MAALPEATSRRKQGIKFMHFCCSSLMDAAMRGSAEVPLQGASIENVICPLDKL